MAALSAWWHDEIVNGPKGPLLFALLAFVITFVVTRSITRMIRAGVGPFRNLSAGSVHLHHSTPGVLLLVAGAFASIAAGGRAPVSYLSAALVGTGASLVLDEFAMIFHLQDVYWSQEGQLSVNVVSLTAVLLAMAVVGVSPVEGPGTDEFASRVRGGLALWLLLHLACCVIAALKGKYATAVIAVFLAPAAWVAAYRLARPTSPWARKFYAPDRLEHARRRAAAFDERWGPLRRRWDDAVGGAPSAGGVAGAGR